MFLLSFKTHIWARRPAGGPRFRADNNTDRKMGKTHSPGRFYKLRLSQKLQFMRVCVVAFPQNARTSISLGNRRTHTHTLVDTRRGGSPSESRVGYG